MVAKSSKSSLASRQAKPIRPPRVRRNQALDRPFAREILAQAKRIVADYQIILECEDGRWYGRGLEMPHVFGDGNSPTSCIADTRSALTSAVAYLLEGGEMVTPPARLGRRSQQVNVRLTAEEKAILEGTARRRGFEGLSDFIRAAALESTR